MKAKNINQSGDANGHESIARIQNAQYSPEDPASVHSRREDKVDIQNIKIKLKDNEELQAVADNPPDVVHYKFNQVVDQILLEFVHTKLD